MNPYAEKLNQCKTYADVFELVKKLVKKYLGHRRSGLMLGLAKLPTYVGALYPMSSNIIIVNKTLLRGVEKLAKSRAEANAFLFNVLLHEYLHSLGYMDESQIGELVYEIAKEALGEDHLGTIMSIRGLWSFFPSVRFIKPNLSSNYVEIVKDFDRSSVTYIS